MQPTHMQAVRDGATENFTIKVDVNNAGHGVTRNIEVQFLKDSSVFNTFVIPELKTGETVTLETKWVPENYGSYNISVIVDPGKSIPELNENNNYANITVGVAGLPGWGFSKKLSIKGTTAGTQTNYPLKLTIRKGFGTDAPGTVYLGSNVRDDFRDIRFTKSDGVTLLDYWVESYTPGGSAEVWVEVDSIPESPRMADVYLYYGNPSAMSASNGDGTFLLFDNFEGNSLNTSKWNVVSRMGGGSITISNSKITIAADMNGGYGIASKTAVSGSLSLEAKGYYVRKKPKDIYVTGYVFIPVALHENNMTHVFNYPPGKGYLTLWYTRGKTQLARWDGSSEYFLVEGLMQMELNRQYNQTLRLDTTYVSWLINDSAVLQAGDTTIRTNLYPQLDSYADAIVEFDDVFLRRFANPEPIWRG